VKKTVLIIGVLCLSIFICISQNNKQYQGRYVIVLDVQSKFYENTKLGSYANEMIKHINSLIEITDPEKIIYIKSAGKMLELSLKHISVDTIPPPPLDTNLKMVSDFVFTKLGGDAFTSADLSAYLMKNSVKEIILVGLLAEECIYNTALGGKKKGYDIYIVPEAVIGKTLKCKEKTLQELKEKGINLVPLNDLIKAP
jgi:nicotinamidase-related amidase